MDSINSLPPLAKTWLLDGPLATHVEAYTANLERGSYSRQTSRSHIDALAHFAHWMGRCTLTASQLDEDCINQFLNFHLPSCDCHSMALRSHDQLRAGLGLLLEVLREERVIAELLPPTGPIAEELNRYDAHMRDARGLAVGTRKDRLYRVGQFLRWKFSDREFTGKDMLVEDLRAFITKELERVNSTSHAQSLAASFRAYFRYRLTCGDEVRGLLGAISTPAQWTLSSLPRALTVGEVQRLMTHCEQTVSSRWRLLSMVRLALDLGLRSGEIAKLELSDIDWRHGTVKLKQTKSMRQDILPLPTATGEALAEYLRHERPITTLKTIFVRLKAPHDQPVGVDAVRAVIGRALRCDAMRRYRTWTQSFPAPHLGVSDRQWRWFHQRCGRHAEAPLLEHLGDLRQARSTQFGRSGIALAWECRMNAAVGLRMRVQEFLREQRNLGFRLVSCGRELLNFASFAEDLKHLGAVTVELTSQWAREAHGGNVSPETSARRLVNLRPFLRWLQQFEAATEVPDDSMFGSLPGRKTPHIYRADEVLALMQEAGKLGPSDGLRAATYATLFGLISATGLRIGEALGLADIDVDLVAGVLTVRGAKFGKSRLVPVHPSVIAPLAAYRATRMKQVPNAPQSLFFVGSRGVHLGKPLGDRQVHRIFTQLRKQLGWVDRGGHGQPRIHDLRHSFAVKRLMLWHEQDVDLNQRILALSTYMGHVRISHTYWYLTGVPELMALAGARFECFACAGEFDHE